MTRTWENRIVGHGEMPAAQFLANPANWRVHPQFQKEALAGVLDSVGWIDEVTINRQTGRIVDGHLRVTLALSQGDMTPVPYREIDVSPEHEALILATKDPIAALATTDDQQLLELVGELQVDDPALAQMLDEMTFGATLAASVADAGPEPKRNLGDKQKQVKAVFYADQLALVERAIAETGLVNRGEAIAVICRAYLAER